MRHDPVGVAFLYRSQAATALRGGGEFHLRGVLDRQHMPPGKSRAGSQAPTFDDLRGRHPRVGEEPTRLQFATAVTTQPAQAYRLARNHPFEDRTPPLSRRTSPNDPSDHSISAPVLRLPGPTESYSRRVGQGISQIDTMRTERRPVRPDVGVRPPGQRGQSPLLRLVGYPAAGGTIRRADRCQCRACAQSPASKHLPPGSPPRSIASAPATSGAGVRSAGSPRCVAGECSYDHSYEHADQGPFPPC